MVGKSEIKLAEIVRKYPALYDKRSKEFKDKNISSLIWSQIANELKFKSGDEAKNKFRNLRKRYTNTKKRFKSVSVSGTSTKQVESAKKALESLKFMFWLDAYIKQRKTKTNISGDDDEDNDEEEDDYDDDEEDDDDDDDDDDDINEEEDVDDEEGDGDEDGISSKLPRIDFDLARFSVEGSSIYDNKSEYAESLEAGEAKTTGEDLTIQMQSQQTDDLLSSDTVTQFPSKNKVRKASKEKAKLKTRMPKMQKVKNWEHSRSVERAELNLLKSLTDKVDGKENPHGKGDICAEQKLNRDECDIFAELVASKMRKLSEDTREEAELAINNILSQYRLSDLRKKSTNSQQHSQTRVHHTQLANFSRGPESPHSGFLHDSSYPTPIVHNLSQDSHSPQGRVFDSSILVSESAQQSSMNQAYSKLSSPVAPYKTSENGQYTNYNTLSSPVPGAVNGSLQF